MTTPERSAPDDAVRPRRRPQLTRRLVVATGLRLVREEGLAAVTMRRIADELGAAPMSLYRHVDDREALLVAMLDRVAAGIPAPAPQLTARAEVRAVLLAIHDALREDPWVVELLVTAGLAGPAILPLVERSFAALAAAGLDPLAARRVYSALMEYTYGEVLVDHHDRPDRFSRRMLTQTEPGLFPHLEAVARATAAADGPPDGSHGGSTDTTPPPDHARHDDYPAVLDGLLDALLPR